ncbi:MAG: thiamine pyrophosphate-dependent enzyme [Pseudomonadota bacterium]
MHVADFSIGMLGANGIVGAGIPITTGSALALKMQGEGHIAVVYFGDGALAEGVVHECFNLASLWSLPVLFVCENNGWSEFSPTENQLSTSLRKITDAFSMAYTDVDGNDVVAVGEAADNLVTAMRGKPDPAVLECRTTRVRGHFEGDKQDYRDAEEISSLDARDPLRKARERLTSDGVAEDWFAGQEDAVAADIDAATEAALAAPEPPIGAVTADVYTPSAA